MAWASWRVNHAIFTQMACLAYILPRSCLAEEVSAIRSSDWQGVAEVLPDNEAEMIYLCDQHDMTLLLDPNSNETHEIPTGWKYVWNPALEPGTRVLVRRFEDKPVWIVSASPGAAHGPQTEDGAR